MNTILYVMGYCPKCGTGPLGVRCCGECGAAWVMCEECDALWEEPQCLQPAQYPEQPDAPCPRCRFSLWQSPSHWATYDDLERLGWQQQIVAQGTALGSEMPDRRREEESPWALPGIDFEERSGLDQEPSAEERTAENGDDWLLS